MNHPGYDLTVSEDRLRYDFASEGPRGSIRKVIEYSYVPWLGMWNLGFGDFDTATGQVSDSIITDNGDGRKVMATVIRTVPDFFSFRPGETVIFTGSDERRTRIYKRIILQYSAEFSDHFIIRGLDSNGDEHSIETDSHYIAFTIKQKVF